MAIDRLNTKKRFDVILVSDVSTSRNENDFLTPVLQDNQQEDVEGLFQTLEEELALT